MFKSMPKCELHAHLNGSLSESTLNKLNVPQDEIKMYQKLAKTIRSSETAKLEECFELFKIAHNATNSTKNLYLATKEVIRDFFYDNVIYLELRTSPKSGPDMTRIQYIEVVVQGIQDALSTVNMDVYLILSIDRSNDDATCRLVMDDIIKMKEKYPNIIKGVDFSGNVAKGKFHRELFEKARNVGLRTAIHCAEIKNDQEVEEILNFKPDRLGHATFLHPKYGGSEKLWDKYCQLKIPVELCLTSNVLCGTSKSYSDHHIKAWIENSLPFTLCTDDKGVFCTTLTEEYQHLFNLNLLSKKDIAELCEKCIKYAFGGDEAKQRFLNKLQMWKRENWDELKN